MCDGASKAREFDKYMRERVLDVNVPCECASSTAAGLVETRDCAVPVLLASSYQGFPV